MRRRRRFLRGVPDAGPSGAASPRPPVTDPTGDVPTSGAGRPLSEPPARRIFVDDALEERFRRDGFVTVPMLTASDAGSLIEAYGGLGISPEDRAHVFYELHGADRARKLAVRALLEPRLADPVRRLFVDHRARAFAFIRREPGDEVDVEPHVDPSFVDESATRSVMIWCSLSGVGPSEGLLYVIPGSHLVGPRRRAHLEPGNSFLEFMDDMSAGLGVAVPLAPGEAILFDHSLIHWAEPNRSDRVGVVAQAMCAPDDVSLTYVLALGGRRGRAHIIDEEFFVSVPFDERPDDAALAGYPSLDEFDLEIEPRVTRARLIELSRGGGERSGPSADPA